MDEDVLVCSKCGSKDVEILAWVDANTHEFICSSDYEEESSYCNVCEEHNLLVLEDEFKNKKR